MALFGFIIAFILTAVFLYRKNTRNITSASTKPVKAPEIASSSELALQVPEPKRGADQQEMAAAISRRTMEGDAPKPSAANLMPPPPRPTISKLSASPSTQSSLRIPSNGPLPNRLPPARSTLSSNNSNSLSAPSTSTLAPSARPRKKVILQPGHSPLDWATKTRSEDLSGVPYPQRITPSQLRTQTGRKGKPAWSSYKGKVYNITPYLPFHPGGEAELMKAAGRDGAKLFEEAHGWVNWENMLSTCLVGFLVAEVEQEEGMDGLD